MTRDGGQTRVGRVAFDVFAEALTSGYCDKEVRFQLGRALMNSASSVFAFPKPPVEDEDRLVEAFILVDSGWGRVRVAWARLREVGDSRARSGSSARGVREARAGAGADPVAEADFVGARRAFTEALAELADAYGQCPAES
jgi:hypothetical protein